MICFTHDNNNYYYNYSHHTIYCGHYSHTIIVVSTDRLKLVNDRCFSYLKYHSKKKLRSDRGKNTKT